MSSVADDSADSLVSVARAVRTRGLKGEIVAELLTDFPERFEGIEQLVALSPDGERKDVELENHWIQNDRVILKLVGVDTVEGARAFTGYQFCVSASETVPLADDEFYDFELEGCLVRELSGHEIGRVQKVLKTGGVAILAITGNHGAEHLVPLAESIVVEIDTAGKRIVIDPPEGLLEL
jgi:16S rRNA processing protein RimM